MPVSLRPIRPHASGSNDRAPAPSRIDVDGAWFQGHSFADRPLPKTVGSLGGKPPQSGDEPLKPLQLGAGDRRDVYGKPEDFPSWLRAGARGIRQSSKAKQALRIKKAAKQAARQAAIKQALKQYRPPSPVSLEEYKEEQREKSERDAETNRLTRLDPMIAELIHKLQWHRAELKRQQLDREDAAAAADAASRAAALAAARDERDRLHRPSTTTTTTTTPPPSQPRRTPTAEPKPKPAPTAQAKPKPKPAPIAQARPKPVPTTQAKPKPKPPLLPPSEQDRRFQDAIRILDEQDPYGERRSRRLLNDWISVLPDTDVPKEKAPEPAGGEGEKGGDGESRKRKRNTPRRKVKRKQGEKKKEKPPVEKDNNKNVVGGSQKPPRKSSLKRGVSGVKKTVSFKTSAKTRVRKRSGEYEEDSKLRKQRKRARELDREKKLRDIREKEERILNELRAPTGDLSLRRAAARVETEQSKRKRRKAFKKALGSVIGKK